MTAALLLSPTHVRRIRRISTTVAVFAMASSADAQVVERRGPARDESPSTPRTWVGGTLTYAAPQGEFKEYVQGAFGVIGHVVRAIDPEGIVAFRADLGYLNYGQTTRRQTLGGGALGLIAVDVTTTNNIVVGGIGLQLLAPSGVVRPYVGGSLGFSYFFTQSSVEGTSNSAPFAETENFSDGLFSTWWGGGLYVPLRRGVNPIALDLGVQAHRNPDVQYLNENSIYIKDTASQPVITPIRSAADFVTFRLGVTFGVRAHRHD